MQTGRETTRVALKLCELAAGVALDAHRRAGAPLGHDAVDHLEVGRVLVEHDLKIGGAGAWEVLGAPFDVERLAAGWAGQQGENTFARTVGAKVVPMRQDREVKGKIGQASIGEGRVIAEELQVAVGAGIHRVEGLVVGRDREGQGDIVVAVVAVVANVGRPWNDVTAPDGERVVR